MSTPTPRPSVGALGDGTAKTDGTPEHYTGAGARWATAAEARQCMLVIASTAWKTRQVLPCILNPPIDGIAEPGPDSSGKLHPGCWHWASWEPAVNLYICRQCRWAGTAERLRVRLLERIELFDAATYGAFRYDRPGRLPLAQLRAQLRRAA